MDQLLHAITLLLTPLNVVPCFGGNWVYNRRTVVQVFLRARDFQEVANFNKCFFGFLQYVNAGDVVYATRKVFYHF